MIFFLYLIHVCTQIPSDHCIQNVNILWKKMRIGYLKKKKKKRTLSSLWHARRHQKKKPHHITHALCTFEPCTLNIYKLSWNPTPKLMRTPIPIILRIMADIKRTGQRISLPRQIRSRLDSIVCSQHKFIR